ncbi:hypothetical protein BAUCODRAFT_68239 [Baudoinia panamericana UAMH 10762]|uniref:Dihydrodipicolinate synthase n=1 Tax=Baudoinia panamericana (strain UAMH 10762) TaxID=717646 RepID=M2NDA4_BAUPA|nr:uncharacterized protein BAUCODRAFT_68239 [Baudoinia panamericana UAMH 10762]EMC96900.1 hypothetical protein BAUCODRAFT_68239 [Baudoinia panamericana UAMH 10762]
MVAKTTSNGHKAPVAYPRGVHVPSLTFFQNDERQEIDWDVQLKHFRFLIAGGVHGVVIAGTNGEAATLTGDEKARLVSSLRKVSDSIQGQQSLPITVGCNGGSTRDVVDDTMAMHQAGADYALVLVPSYFHFAMNQDAIVAFFTEVADKSPLPVCIYNFPNVVAGLDVNSEMLAILGKHPNIAAVKLTCGGIAKVARVAADFPPEEFAALAGQSDWLIPCLATGGQGCITGLANLYPKTCVELYDLWTHGKRAEAEDLQLELAKVEWGFAKGGINGTKWIVARMLGYPESSAACRRPYPAFEDEARQLWIERTMAPLVAVEKRLSLAAKSRGDESALLKRSLHVLD